MAISNCKRCGKIYDSATGPICEACVKELDELFLKVRDFIYKNPTKNMHDVSKETEVPMKMLQQWVREEKLSFSKESGVALTCENCGAKIYTGRFCKDCKERMSDRLNGIFQEKKPQNEGKKTSGARMHFLK